MLSRLINFRDPAGVRFLILGLFMVVLATYTFISTTRLQAENDKQTDCLLDYISAKSETDKIRSKLVERESAVNRHESEATRSILVPAMTGKIKTEARFFELGRLYITTLDGVDAELDAIEKERKANPPRVFTPKQCGIKGRAKTKKAEDAK